jgi:hypothetical protein
MPLPLYGSLSNVARLPCHHSHGCVLFLNPLLAANTQALCANHEVIQHLASRTSFNVIGHSTVVLQARGVDGDGEGIGWILLLGSLMSNDSFFSFCLLVFQSLMLFVVGPFQRWRHWIMTT